MDMLKAVISTVIGKSLQGLLLSALLVQLAWGQQFEWAPSYPAGSSIPLLEAPDQHGELQSLDTLTGEAGLVLLFNRSFDWCPYCKAQLADLVEVADDFEALGYRVAAMTYDPVETLDEVAQDMAVDFPLLHDEAVTHVKAWGILNADYQPGHFAYGIPEPGIVVISPQGRITHKFAEQDYRMRPDFQAVLETLE